MIRIYAIFRMCDIQQLIKPNRRLGILVKDGNLRYIQSNSNTPDTIHKSENIKHATSRYLPTFGSIIFKYKGDS